MKKYLLSLITKPSFLRKRKKKKVKPPNLSGIFHFESILYWFPQLKVIAIFELDMLLVWLRSLGYICVPAYGSAYIGKILLRVQRSS